MANSKSKSKSNQEVMPIFGKNGCGKAIIKHYETGVMDSKYKCEGDCVGYICGIDGLKSFSQRFFDRHSEQLSWEENTPFYMCESILNGKDIKSGRHWDYSISVNDEGHLVAESEHWSSNTSLQSYYNTFEFVPVDETEAELVALNGKTSKNSKYGHNIHSMEDHICAAEIEEFNQEFHYLSDEEKKLFPSLKSDKTTAEKTSSVKKDEVTQSSDKSDGKVYINNISPKGVHTVKPEGKPEYHIVNFRVTSDVSSSGYASISCKKNELIGDSVKSVVFNKDHERTVNVENDKGEKVKTKMLVSQLATSHQTALKNQKSANRSNAAEAVSSGVQANADMQKSGEYDVTN